MITEEELLLQSANCPTMYFDGFRRFRCVNGVMRCIGYVIGGGAQLNVIVSREGADQANKDARAALDGEQPTNAFSIWEGGAGRSH